MAYQRSADDIHGLFTARQKSRDPVLRRMEDIRSRYQDEVIVPLPQMDQAEKTYVANLLQKGLDNYGRMIASTMPNLHCPPKNPRADSSKTKADIRRRATLAWWEANRIELKMGRRARWLVGYGVSPVVLRPDFDLGIPRWEPRDPLGTYPAPCVDPDDLTPADVIFAVKKPLREICDRWPAQAAALCSDYDRERSADRLLNVLEYEDAEQRTFIVINSPDWAQRYGSKHMILDTVPNRTGICNAVIPGRIALDRPIGQFDGMVGMMDMQAKLMALEVIAVQRTVFPEQFLVARQNETAAFIAGPFTGAEGKVNIVEGGDITYKSPTPGQMTWQAIDRLERATRVEGGVNADMSGESGSNIRTGKRGQDIMSALVDLPVQEAQKMLAASLEEENYRATKIAREYFGARKQSFDVKWKGAKGPVDYTPDKDFDSDYTQVSYAMAGADTQNLTIGVQGLVASELISRETARKMHPWVRDADLEGDLITSESMHAALMGGLQQKIADGSIPPADAARIMALVVGDNMPLFKAVIQVQEEAQERQAAIDAEGQPTGVDPLSAAAQPGLADPGMGAEAGMAPPVEGPPDLNSMSSMFNDLRSVGRGAGAVA